MINWKRRNRVVTFAGMEPILRKFLAVLLGATLLTAATDQPVEKGRPVDRAKPADSAKPFVPVFEENFPDPFILRSGNEFLAYATNADGGKANVQMARSVNLVEWELIRDGDKLHDAMPVLPPWAREGFTWAPEVIKLGDRYVLYFTAREAASGLQCVGVASGDNPKGPFSSTAAAPLVCQRELGGTIDPSMFRDADGQLYLYFKSDGNNPRFLKPSQIFVQRLSADGLTLEDEAKPLIRNDQHWEWRVVESPTMVRNDDGRYTLLFSANHFGWENDQRLSNYAMGYARCDSATGPCVKARENPILHSYNSKRAGCLSGPGHQTVFEVADKRFLVFHAWSATKRCERSNKGRHMYIAPLSWRGDTPVIANSLRQSSLKRKPTE